MRSGGAWARRPADPSRVLVGGPNLSTIAIDREIHLSYRQYPTGHVVFCRNVEQMYDPSMRVLTVLELLQARERVTGKELAEHLEVSDRTVQRYIMRLQDLGVPVESTRGPGGYYRLKPGFRIPPLMFDADEALAVSIGLDALGSIGLGRLPRQPMGRNRSWSGCCPCSCGSGSTRCAPPWCWSAPGARSTPIRRSSRRWRWRSTSIAARASPISGTTAAPRSAPSSRMD